MVVTFVDAVGQTKKAKIGFSWTTFFFGFFVPLFRGDAKWTIVMLLAGIFTALLANILLSFLYNRFYICDLLSNGFRPADDSSEHALRSNGFIL